jgi:transcriptional regulator with XRE-family HTH domain
MSKQPDSIALMLGKRVRILREKQNITQETLAQRSKLGVKHVQFVESKHPHNVTIRTLQKLADGFDIPLWKLLRFEE